MARIAFIGLGNMGGPMAHNLVKAGHDVAGYDLAATLLTAAKANGVGASASARACGEGADVLITMLPSGQDVLAVWREILPAAGRDRLMIDCSTIDVESARAAHELAAEAGALSLDAPVSGGTGGARAASLTFMCGGTPEAFDGGKPILGAMGKKIVHCGSAGSGQAAKICNNMILGATMIATCEAFVLAEKLGLSHQALFDVASTSSGQSWSLTTYCPVPGPVPSSPANQAYRPGFAAGLMRKDLKLAQQAAAQAGAAIPLGAAALQLYELLCAQGQGERDFSAIIGLLRGSIPPSA
jgi:3-hydroxyisobutyrate dehydrogenase